MWLPAHCGYIDAMINCGNFQTENRKLKTQSLEVSGGARNLNVNEQYNSILDSLKDFEVTQ